MSESPALSSEEIANRFRYHPPAGAQPEVYEEIRGRARALAEYIAGVVRSNRESSLAFTHLEQAVMWANASVARHGLREEGTDG